MGQSIPVHSSSRRTISAPPNAQEYYFISTNNIPEFPLQNILFYYDSEQSSKPSGVLFLEGCYCERLVSAPSGLGTPGGTNGGHGHKHGKEEKLQVSVYYVLFTVKLNRQIIIIPELGSWSFSLLLTWPLAGYEPNLGGRKHAPYSYD